MMGGLLARLLWGLSRATGPSGTKPMKYERRTDLTEFGAPLLPERPSARLGARQIHKIALWPKGLVGFREDGLS